MLKQYIKAIIFLFILATSIPQTNLKIYNNISNECKLSMVDINIDKSFSIIDRNIIELAINDWNVAMGDTFQFKISDQINLDTIFIKKIFDGDKILNEIENAVRSTEYYKDAVLLGYYYRENIKPIIYIIPERITDGSTYKSVVLHELGHSLGLSHSSNMDSIMYPITGYNEGIIFKDDYKQFCTIYKCSDENSQIP